MTEEDLLKLEMQVRDHKARGMSSNITLKVNQVEELLSAVRETQTGNVIDFDIRAQARANDQHQNQAERKFIQRWATAAQLFKTSKEILQQRNARLEARKLQKQKNLDQKWEAYKNFVGNQNQKTNA